MICAIRHKPATLIQPKIGCFLIIFIFNYTFTTPTSFPINYHAKAEKLSTIKQQLCSLY